MVIISIMFALIEKYFNHEVGGAPTDVDPSGWLNVLAYDKVNPSEGSVDSNIPFGVSLHILDASPIACPMTSFNVLGSSILFSLLKNHSFINPFRC